MLLQPTDAIQTPTDSNVWMASLLVILTDEQPIRLFPTFNETLFTPRSIRRATLRDGYCVNQYAVHNRPVMRGTFRLLLVAIALVAVGAGCTGIKVDQSVSPMRLLLPGLLGG